MFVVINWRRERILWVIGFFPCVLVSFFHPASHTSNYLSHPVFFGNKRYLDHPKLLQRFYLFQDFHKKSKTKKEVNTFLILFLIKRREQIRNVARNTFWACQARRILNFWEEKPSSMDGLVIETPRLTAVFRSFLTEAGKSYDYQNEYIHARKEAINARSKKYSSSFLV